MEKRSDGLKRILLTINILNCKIFYFLWQQKYGDGLAMHQIALSKGFDVGVFIDKSKRIFPKMENQYHRLRV